MFGRRIYKSNLSKLKPFQGNNSYRYLSQINQENNNLSDLEVDRNYNFSAKFSVFLDTLQNNDEFERYQNTIKQLNSDGIGAILTWIDLQHPLLKKYKFDPVEFLEGAKYSFIKVHSIIHSEEFNKYVNEEIEESENINFLKSNSTIRGFNSFIFYQKQHGLYSGSKETFHIIRLLRARIEVFEGKVEIENKPPSLDDFFKPPTPGLVGFEKVQNSSTNSKNNEESDEENIKDNSPVPPLTEKGVILSTLCAVEVKREEKNLGAKMIFYRLQGDISKGDDMEWKISDIYYPS